MTVWKPTDRTTYRYKFFATAGDIKGTPAKITQADAAEWEHERMRAVRRHAGGLSVAPEHSPFIQDWAEVYFDQTKKKGRVRRIDHVEVLIRGVLRFWGAPPEKGPASARAARSRRRGTTSAAS